MKKIRTLFASMLLFILIAQSQPLPDRIRSEKWKASWITVPAAPPHDYGVYLFRKSFQLENKPNSFIVHVSADNRYKLYVNGQWVSLGPARGDLFHWNFETVDIAPALKQGENVIGAVVWNFGDQSPEAQISYRTAFILQGNGEQEDLLNSDTSWKCIQDKAYRPLTPKLIYSYYVAGPGEQIDYNLAPGKWMESGFPDKDWNKAQALMNGAPKGVHDWSYGWMLIPRMIPQMELTLQRIGTVRRSGGITVPAGFLKGESPLRIPANSKISVLFDQGYLTNGYPVLKFSQGKAAKIRLSYAEGLYINEGDDKDWRSQQQKGNRDEIENKRFVGVTDEIRPNGETDQVFESLWWRTWRYMQMEIETGAEPLVIEDLYAQFTGYPFQRKAKFESDKKELDQILDVGWRTARLCAVETYMDCPYYEQLQYVGDTRIQALVSLYNTGDNRLMRNAISQLDLSRMPEGNTLSRYPTAHAQEIPPFSLWWIGMVHDYWMYQPDPAFVKQFLPGIRQVLHFFSQYQQPDGSLRNTPYWNFTDWAEGKGWDAGVAPIGKNGNSSNLDLQLLWAYQLASELEAALGLKELSQQYKTAASLLQSTILKKYWVADKKCFADMPEKNLFSQHANILAILTGTVTGTDAKNLCSKVISDSSLIQATIYFKYYLHRAVVLTGLGNRYLDLLDIWHQNLAMGMTTWAEISDINNARSDCHAWGASPNIELFRVVLGIESGAPGFQTVLIEPHLGNLTRASGSIPHPKGELSVNYQRNADQLKCTVDLPRGTTGVFRWNGKEKKLAEGRNEFTIK